MITRDTFLYMEGNTSDFAQCETCRDWIPVRNRCVIHSDDVEVRKRASCNLYVKGPVRPPTAQGRGWVTPKQSGLVNREVRCENCKYGGDFCHLYAELNRSWPTLFNLETKIKPTGCCNAQTPESRSKST